MFKLSKIDFALTRLYKHGFSTTVRAGTGGDEAGIWAGDMVRAFIFLLIPFIRSVVSRRIQHALDHSRTDPFLCSDF